MGGIIDPLHRAGFDAGQLALALSKLVDPAEHTRAKQRMAAQTYLDFLPFRKWLIVTTSARSLAAAGVV